MRGWVRDGRVGGVEGPPDSYRHTRSSCGDLDTPGVHAPSAGVIGQPARQQIMANDLPVPSQLPYLTHFQSKTRGIGYRIG
ncbi:hypothetical protein M0802_003054 [Mischocyttarus mexicanus]|nr:hypothetical protein M0802_003054 [Mischocyttarus mexicanus]